MRVGWALTFLSSQRYAAKRGLPHYLQAMRVKSHQGKQNKTATFEERTLISKKTHWSLPFTLRHTERVRLSHDRLMSRGGACVGSSWAFKQPRSARKHRKHK